MEQTTKTKPKGKGLAISGFVISLVAIVLYSVIALIVAGQALLGGGYGLGVTWLIVSLLGAGLSAMGMVKLNKTGGKKGLAIAGLIIGLIATITTATLVMKIGSMQQAGSDLGDTFKDAMEQGVQEMKSEMNQAVDSLQEAH